VAKDVKVYLIKQRPGTGYKVSRTINVLRPVVGEVLTKEEVGDLIREPRIFSVIIDGERQERRPYRPLIAHNGEE
jgi:hypothetical protein